MEASQLHPWPVLREFVLALPNHDIPDVLGRTGMRVDWSLTPAQDYSAKLRVAAYRPKMDATIDCLTDEDKLRVCAVVAEQLTNRGHGTTLIRALQDIGWTVQAGRLSPSGESVSEIFFPRESFHSAYVVIREILQKAHSSIVVVDPYVGSTLLTLLSSMAASVNSIKLLMQNSPLIFDPRSVLGANNILALLKMFASQETFMTDSSC